MKISVVIPLLNKGPHVERTLNSVLRQTVQNFEVIVIEGGSYDNGPVLVENFACKDSRIRLVQQEGKGVSKARNQGVRESKSELVAFLDADDEWMPNYLETILQLRKKYPDAGLYATSIRTDLYDNILMRLAPELRKYVPEEGLVSDYFKIYKGGDYLFGTSSTTVPMKVFSEIGGFQPEFWWGEDTDMWCRIALKYSIAYSSQVCAIYYQNVVNSACKRKKPVIIHPFVKSAREALNTGEIPYELMRDLVEYIQYIEVDTARHNFESGDKTLVFDLLSRTDIEPSYKQKLYEILSIEYEGTFAASSENLFPNPEVVAANLNTFKQFPG